MNEITLFELAQAFHEGNLTFREYMRMLHYHRRLESVDDGLAGLVHRAMHTIGNAATMEGL